MWSGGGSRPSARASSTQRRPPESPAAGKQKRRRRAQPRRSQECRSRAPCGPPGPRLRAPQAGEGHVTLWLKGAERCDGELAWFLWGRVESEGSRSRAFALLSPQVCARYPLQYLFHHQHERETGSTSELQVIKGGSEQEVAAAQLTSPPSRAARTQSARVKALTSPGTGGLSLRPVQTSQTATRGIHPFKTRRGLEVRARPLGLGNVGWCCAPVLASNPISHGAVCLCFQSGVNPGRDKKAGKWRALGGRRGRKTWFSGLTC